MLVTMDFVHYQPPQQRHAKAKADRKNSAKSMDQVDDGGHSDAKDKASQDGPDRSKAGGKGDGADLDGSTRPRLSPEQVWLLEQQFQAEPKPNSHTKRHLAGLTRLSLPRVAVSTLVVVRLCPRPPLPDGGADDG